MALFADLPFCAQLGAAQEKDKNATIIAIKYLIFYLNFFEQPGRRSPYHGIGFHIF